MTFDPGTGEKLSLKGNQTVSKSQSNRQYNIDTARTHSHYICKEQSRKAKLIAKPLAPPMV